MSDWNLPWDGGCRCGRVRLRVAAPPLISSACHCTGCQRMTSSAYALTLTLPTPGLQITTGETVIGGLHGEVRHHFCAHCMTWMFTRPGGDLDFVNLRPTMLDEHGWFVPFVDVWTEEGLPWARTPAVHSFDRVPELDQWPDLVRAFAEQGARPPLR